MIFITGDTHGDYRRFNTEYFPEQKKLTKSDYVVICGDFGIWDRSREQAYWLDWLQKKPFTTLFVTGNHSNYDLLKEYPVSRWHGGKVQFIRPSVIHLMRGQFFDLDGKSFFTMGGASCHDVQGGILDRDDPNFKAKLQRARKIGLPFRINHLSWWKEELPSQEEYEEARLNLEKHGWKADCVITHCCPTSLIADAGNSTYSADALTDFLEEVKEKLDFTWWFFGHYHDNAVFHRRFILLYEQILSLPRQTV
jgi:predicted phosphodiesterase